MCSPLTWHTHTHELQYSHPVYLTSCAGLYLFFFLHNLVYSKGRGKEGDVGESLHRRWWRLSDDARKEKKGLAVRPCAPPSPPPGRAGRRLLTGKVNILQPPRHRDDKWAVIIYPPYVEFFRNSRALHRQRVEEKFVPWMLLFLSWRWADWGPWQMCSKVWLHYTYLACI